MFGRIDSWCKRKFEEYAKEMMQNMQQTIIDSQREEISNLKKEIEIIKRGEVADILRGVEKAIANSKMNEKAFAQYKNIHQGKKVVICGAGPSLAKYEPIEDAIHIAVNRSFLFDKVKFDYIFVQDYRGIELITEELKEYQGNHCIKFFGTQNGSRNDEIPESYALECGAVRYATDGYIWLFEDKCQFAFEMNSKSIGNFATIALPALQFALWTNPREIYIVGCDTTKNGHFKGEMSENARKITSDESYDRMIKDWCAVKEYADLYYPDTKIFSVNPIGLKGIFEDI